jgi:hypothetical protein
MEEKVENLKKRLRFMRVMIGILLFITISSFVYCYFQIRRAKEELESAHRYEQIAARTAELVQCKQDLIRLKIIAQKSAAEAEMNAMEALRQNQRAEEALKKLSKK